MADSTGIEVDVDVSDTVSKTSTRRADALVWFLHRDNLFGDGLAVEVQYKNEQKDIKATTHDYLSNGISVYWADTGDFENERFLIQQALNKFNTESGSKIAYSAVHDALPPLTADEDSINTSDEPVDVGEDYSRKDPIPGCRHELIPDRGRRNICLRCGIEVSVMVYYEKEDRFVSPNYGVDGTKEVVFDLRTVENDYEPPDIEEKGDIPKTHRHLWSMPGDRPYHTEHTCRKCSAVIRLMENKAVIDHR
jgi:hypothetical protein